MTARAPLRRCRSRPPLRRSLERRIVMKHTQVSWTVIAVSSALLGLAGCETAPETSGVLNVARNSVSAAEADPNVAKYAPTELDRARKLLANAEGAAKEKGGKDK